MLSFALLIESRELGRFPLQQRSFCSSNADLSVLRSSRRECFRVQSDCQPPSGRSRHKQQTVRCLCFHVQFPEHWNYSNTVFLSILPAWLGKYPRWSKHEEPQNFSGWHTEKCERNVSNTAITFMRISTYGFSKELALRSLFLCLDMLFATVLESFPQSGVLFIRAPQAHGGTQ